MARTTLMALVALTVFGAALRASPQVVEIKTLPGDGSSFVGVNGGNGGWYAGYGGITVTNLHSSLQCRRNSRASSSPPTTVRCWATIIASAKRCRSTPPHASR